MNHLIYITFGEQTASVYATQVKQLLNYWSKRDNWKITLIQIADASNLGELEPEVNKIFIKRKFKILFSKHKREYVRQINKKLLIDDEDQLYFNSRGGSAYSIASTYIATYGIDYICNNLDVRGTIEELKFSKTRRIFYPFFKLRLNRLLKDVLSITAVTTNLKDHLIKDKNIINPKVHIEVIPTLSILEFKATKSKKDIAFIGNIAWIDPKLFVKQILKINELFFRERWTISIIGNSSGSFGLKSFNIRFIDRMPPSELKKNLLNYHTGLVLRDYSIINRVAAPCKISDYLCLGMPVIYSGEIGSLKDFINLFPECEKFITHIDKLISPGRIGAHTNISQEEMKTLSQKAQSYFGVQAVIDKYINFFNSRVF